MIPGRHLDWKRLRELLVENRLIVAIVLAVIVGAWMFRFESVGPWLHRNRITGSICYVTQECWIPGDRR
jgi:hypothetical protein